MPPSCGACMRRARPTRRQRPTWPGASCCVRSSGWRETRPMTWSSNACARMCGRPIRTSAAWEPLLAIGARRGRAAHARGRGAGRRVPRRAPAQGRRRVLQGLLTGPTLLEFRDGHLMDHASAALLGAVARAAPDAPWLVIVTCRDTGSGFSAARGPGVVRARAATARARATPSRSPRRSSRRRRYRHMSCELAAERSGGSPQFLRDLLRAAEADGGASALPASIEAAAMARLDLLSPADRALICRAAVLGVIFDPQLLADVLDSDTRPPDERTWARLWRYFEPAPDGHMRFIRPYVREAAYANLPFGIRRVLHSSVGERLEREAGERGRRTRGRSFRCTSRAPASTQKRGGTLASPLTARATGSPTPTQPRSTAGRWMSRARWTSHRQSAPSCGRAWARPARTSASWPARPTPSARRGGSSRVTRCEAPSSSIGTPEWTSSRAAWLVRAVRWTRRGLRVLERIEGGREAAGCRAHLAATLATLRQRQGRMEEAIGLCRGAIAEAEAAGADAARGQRLLHPRLGARRVGPGPRGGALRARAGPLRQAGTPRSTGNGPQQHGRLRLPRRTLGRGGRPLSTQRAASRAGRRRRELRVRRLQRGRGAGRPGPARRGRRPAAARAAHLALDRPRVGRRVRRRAARTGRGPRRPPRRRHRAPSAGISRVQEAGDHR